METRTILQITLAVLVALIVALAGYIFYLFAWPTDVQVVETIVQENAAAVEVQNPWEDQGGAAITLVKAQRILAPPPKPKKEEEARRRQAKEEEPEPVPSSVGELMEREDYVRDVLKLAGPAPKGWTVQWWGETQYGEWFYLVRYVFEDEMIEVGPAWLVDLKGAKVLPKNVLARVVMDSAKGVKDDYYDKHKQVVKAIASHRFESGPNLGGALLMYFAQLTEESGGGAPKEAEDKILGWTIEHDRGPVFKAYFQWVDEGEPTYAEFEFDYSAKALKANNFYAAEVMRQGEDFSEGKRATILPDAYDREERKWVEGPCRNRKLLKKRAVRDQCKALATMLGQVEIIEAVEWLLTQQVSSPDAFAECKEDRRCRWGAKLVSDGLYEISYKYNLDEGDGEEDREDQVAWKVALSEDAVTPIDRTAAAAWRAVQPRF
ncbi:MAG: hypothetical protein AAGI01_03575 [Myxococcota bacterium]